MPVIKTVRTLIPKVKYNDIGQRITTIQFEVINLDMLTEAHLVNQAVTSNGLADIEIAFLMPSMAIDTEDKPVNATA